MQNFKVNIHGFADLNKGHRIDLLWGQVGQIFHGLASKMKFLDIAFGYISDEKCLQFLTRF